MLMQADSSFGDSFSTSGNYENSGGGMIQEDQLALTDEHIENNSNNNNQDQDNQDNQYAPTQAHLAPPPPPPPPQQRQQQQQHQPTAVMQAKLYSTNTGRLNHQQQLRAPPDATVIPRQQMQQLPLTAKVINHTQAPLINVHHLPLNTHKRSRDSEPVTATAITNNNNNTEVDSHVIQIIQGMFGAHEARIAGLESLIVSQTQLITKQNQLLTKQSTDIAHMAAMFEEFKLSASANRNTAESDGKIKACIEGLQSVLIAREVGRLAPVIATALPTTTTTTNGLPPSQLQLRNPRQQQQQQQQQPQIRK